MAVTAVRKTNPVEIAIVIRKFEEILKTGRAITDFRLVLTKRDPRVLIEGDVIHVKRPKTTIRFTIANSSGNKINFYPTGITFVREVPGSKINRDQCESDENDRLGLLNFPQRKLRYDRQTLSITDNYRNGKETIRYKFSVLIQQGSDGKIGIIDPAISHDNAGLR